VIWAEIETETEEDTGIVAATMTGMEIAIRMAAIATIATDEAQDAEPRSVVLGEVTREVRQEEGAAHRLLVARMEWDKLKSTARSMRRRLLLLHRAPFVNISEL